METTEIQTLIERSKQQDSHAFKLLVEAYQDFVFRLAFKLIVNYEEAQDITQETFIRVWTHLPQFDLHAKFTTWLYKITVNLCYDLLRSRKHHPQSNYEIVNLPTSLQLLSEENPEHEIINSELTQIITELTQKLTPKQRLIFTLWDLEDLEPEEVRNISGLSRAKIKSNLYLARKKIREKIEKLNS